MESLAYSQIRWLWENNYYWWILFPRSSEIQLWTQTWNFLGGRQKVNIWINRKRWRKLAGHLDVDNILKHYPVNHSKNFVDPETGSHTQTIERLWSNLKDFLPVRGMKPRDLRSFLGWFMWTRYCKQRKLDGFIHFLKSAVRLDHHLISRNSQLQTWK